MKFTRPARRMFGPGRDTSKGGTGRRGALTVIGVVLSATALTAIGGRAGAVPTPDGRPSSSAPPEAPTAPSPSAAPDAPNPPTDPAARTEPEMRSTSDRTVAYTLSAELFPDTHTVRGSGSITWRNTARVATDRLYVHLYLNAFKSERTVFWRVPVSGFRGDPLNGPGRMEVDRFFVREFERDLWPKDPHTPDDPEDATDIEIMLPRPVEPGESLTIDTSWTSHLPTVTIRTGYLGSFHMVGQWFPKLARLEPDGTWAHFPFHRMSEFYADYGVYDVTVSAPSSFTVGAVGSLVSQTTAPPSQVPSAPTPSATESASAPPEPPKSTQETPLNTVRRFTAADVHDFAFSAWDKFQTLEDQTAAGVKITCLYPPGYDDAARIEIDAVKFGLGYLGAAFGVYPYKTLTIVHPPNGAEEAGGMEYPTLITTGGSWRTGGIIQTREREILTLHELAHQWFYGLVGSNEHRYPFLDEGLTSYAEVEAFEAKWPDTSAAELFGLRVGMPAIYRAGALEATLNARVSDGAAEFVAGRDYGSLVYSRSAATMRTLGNVFGHDAVRRAVGKYAREYRFSHPTAEDFFASVRESLGPEAGDALRIALSEPSSIDLVAEDVDSWRRTDDKPGYVGHVLVRRRGALRFPVDVLLIAEDGSTTVVRWDAQKAAALLPYEGQTPLVAAVIDPQHRVHLDEDLANNAVSSNGRTFPWRAFEGGAFVFGAILRGTVP